MDTATALGLIIGLGSLIVSMVLEFGELNPNLGSAFLKISALLIIFGGTLGCTMVSFAMEEVMKVPRLLAIAFSRNRMDPQDLVERMVSLADTARRDGLLALESQKDAVATEYPLVAKGLRLVIDGVAADAVQAILDTDISHMQERHAQGVNLFNALGGYAPTMGIVGTVIGLIGALAKAGEGDPNTVVEAIATAFIATFYGIASANLVFLPLASKLKARSEEEAFEKTVQVEAVLALQNGVPARLMTEMLRSYFRADRVVVKE